jgi:hypothetical protein
MVPAEGALMEHRCDAPFIGSANGSRKLLDFLNFGISEF